MSEPFIGQIMIVGFNFAPRGWATCDGQLLPISQNQALFALLGTTYGGDGRTTFALPNLQGRVPIHPGLGSGHTLGEAGGTETHTLSVNQLPAHTHAAKATATTHARCSSQAGAVDSPVGMVWSGSSEGDQGYRGSPDAEMAANAVEVAVTVETVSTGGSQPINNMPPFLAVNFVIALQGIFPSRN